MSAHVAGQPYHTACSPPRCAAGAGIGDNVTFTVSFFANPDPREDQWQWSFTSHNQNATVNSNPDSITFSIREGYIILIVNEVTVDLFGNYIVTSVNEYGDDQTVLQLLPEGKFYVFVLTAP